MTHDPHKDFQIVRQYAKDLIAQGAWRLDGFDPGGPSLWHYFFGANLHDDPRMREAFNIARYTPEYAANLASECNGSIFDDSFGDLSERTGESAMCSAFANYMADLMLSIMGQNAAAMIENPDTSPSLANLHPDTRR